MKSVVGAWSLLVAMLAYLALGQVDILVSHFVGSFGSWLSYIALQIAGPSLILAYLLSRRLLTAHDLGLRPVPDAAGALHVLGAAVFCAVAWYLAAAAVHVAGSPLLRAFPDLAKPLPMASLVAESGALRILAATCISVCYGVFEEIYYRGITFILARRASDRYWRIVYVLGSAFLFASVHWARGFPAVTANLGAGLVAALLFMKLRDLRPLIIAHVGLDLMAFL